MSVNKRKYAQNKVCVETLALDPFKYYTSFHNQNFI